MSRGRIPAVLVLLALAYLPLFVVLSRANYNPLVNDHRPYARTTLGLWPGVLRAQLNPLEPDQWLYRPLPESLEWGLSEAFRGRPGGWHCAILAFRVLTVGLVWHLAGRLSSSAATRAAVTAYVALFPSFPEAQLIYAETQILPLLAAVLLGLTRLATAQGPPRGWVVLTGIAFVLLTLCKEILAPMSAVLFVALVPVLRPWRSRTGLLAVSGMGLALLFQGWRCLRTVAAPYARQDEIPDRGLTALTNLDWFVGRTLLWTTNLKLTSLVLAGLVLLAAAATARSVLAGRWRDRLPVLTGLAALGAVLVVYLASPYRALRYVYPAAVLLVPALALGLDLLGTRWAKARTAIAAFLVLVLFALNAPVLWSQAVANRTSTDSDWALLEYLARRRAKGADIALSERLGAERLEALRAEVHGDWRIPGFTPMGGEGRWLEFGSEAPQPSGDRTLILVLRKDLVDGSDAAAGEERHIPPKVPSSRLAGFLAAFEPLARRLNADFAYPQDAGSTRFPGHRWRVRVRRPAADAEPIGPTSRPRG